MKFSYHCVARIIGTFVTIETAPAMSGATFHLANPMPSSTPNPLDSTPPVAKKRRAAADQTVWRRPAGVSAGTWRYAHEGSIAVRYDDFVAGTPLCRVDLGLLAEMFPEILSSHNQRDEQKTGGDSGATETHMTPGNQAEKKNGEERKWVLDLGCGTGRASELLAAGGYDVLAIDLSMPMLHQVRERDLGSVVPIQANLVELDAVADNIAAGAVCLFSTLGMIQGRNNRRRFLSHVRRIVQPTCPFYLHAHHRYAALTRLPGIRQLAGSAM